MQHPQARTSSLLVDAEQSTTPPSIGFRCVLVVTRERIVVEVRGNIDIFTATTFRQKVFAALATPVRRVVLDFGYVSFMDSSGLAVLADAHKKAETIGVSLSIASVPRQVRTVLSVTGLAEQFGVSER